MSTIMQFVCCIVISFLVWFVLGVILLSPQVGILGTDAFGPPMTPISIIVIAASIIGLVQGSLMSGLIVWNKPKVVLLDCLYSFIATEIFLLPTMLIILILFFKSTNAIFSFSNLVDSLIFFVFYYLVLSLLFLIPSVIIGFVSGKVLDFTNLKV